MALLGVLFDGGLAVLLIVTIGYCSRLSRRIRLLQDSRSELAGMITQFDQATGRAMASLSELQTVSKRITDALQLKIEKANFLADDLAFLIEKSAKLAHQLEQAKTALPEKAQASAPKPAEPQPFFQGGGKSSGASFVKPRPAIYPPPQVADMPPSVKSAASLEALLNRLASSQATSVPAKPPSPQTPRTEAERELLDALKSGR